MPQITITVSDAVLKALQSKALMEDVSVADLLRAAIVELTDDGITPELREIIEQQFRDHAGLFRRLAEGPRTYHNIDAR